MGRSTDERFMALKPSSSLSKQNQRRLLLKTVLSFSYDCRALQQQHKGHGFDSLEMHELIKSASAKFINANA